jgi:hypothetical protein
MPTPQAVLDFAAKSGAQLKACHERPNHWIVILSDGRWFHFEKADASFIQTRGKDTPPGAEKRRRNK